MWSKKIILAAFFLSFISFPPVLGNPVNETEEISGRNELSESKKVTFDLDEKYSSYELREETSTEKSLSADEGEEGNTLNRRSRSRQSYSKRENLNVDVSDEEGPQERMKRDARDDEKAKSTWTYVGVGVGIGALIVLIICSCCCCNCCC